MSQRSAKMNRRIDRLERKYETLEMYIDQTAKSGDRQAKAFLKAVQQRNDSRSDYREAARAVKVWRNIAYAGLLAGIAALLVAILATAPAEACEAEPQRSAVVVEVIPGV